jgi:hypothetical protein
MSRPRVLLRTLTTEEETEIRRLANSRKESLRLVQRARLIVAMLDDPMLDASKAGMQVGFKNNSSGSAWVKRFNDEGVAGLDDKPRSGKPVTHTEEANMKNGMDYD